MLWAVFTIIAAAAQTARNAMQRELTVTLGTVGATHVRFLFGFPFALIFLAGVCIVTASGLPTPSLEYWPWIAIGIVGQIVATALMLAAMSDSSFVVTTAYIKTEPVQTAVFGLVLLGDRLTPMLALAIVVATAGVVIVAMKPGAAKANGLRPAVKGIVAGGLFGLSAIGFRGAILSLNIPDQFVLASTFTLAVSLVIQAALLSGYLLLREPAVLRAIFRAWRPSMFAGFMGAFASQFWFLGFSIAAAASVRTLALIEVLFAQGVSKFAFKQKTSLREVIGIAMIIGGVALLIWAH
ncbi:DMT family transporter [Undibacter mobilis]|uniref:DMT family transporter n=1 Tax=Undibacter mobilis TaxID=2292256 RepID=A0A371B8C3_9BRAD|nr:DMT family transporter [Undibacter mobilis]RDV03828.1 DMT family transporter [Undibacter mobilis]